MLTFTISNKLTPATLQQTKKEGDNMKQHLFFIALPQRVESKVLAPLMFSSCEKVAREIIKDCGGRLLVASIYLN